MFESKLDGPEFLGMSSACAADAKDATKMIEKLEASIGEHTSTIQDWMLVVIGITCIVVLVIDTVLRGCHCGFTSQRAYPSCQLK
jgi:hypothetical protein